MLIIHPQDKTTAMLAALYEGREARLLRTPQSRKEMSHQLRHTPAQELIMLLGHGSESGLFYREDDGQDTFDGIIVGHPEAWHLRRHGHHIIGIWCNAIDFARQEGLHGLFSGMIISEMGEAAQYGIPTDKRSMDRCNAAMFRHLRLLLDSGARLSEIPQMMRDADREASPLSEFNYSHFHFL